MRNIRLPLPHISVATIRCQYQGGWVTSSNEQVWTDLQWSPKDVTSRSRCPGLMSEGCLGALPCGRFHDVFDVTYHSSPLDRQMPVKQVCIPVRCVPTLTVAISERGGCLPVQTLPWQTPQQTPLGRQPLFNPTLHHIVYTRPPHHTPIYTTPLLQHTVPTPHPDVNIMTHVCESITFPTTFPQFKKKYSQK